MGYTNNLQRNLFCSYFWNKAHFVRVTSLRSGVIHGFVTEPWHFRHVLFLTACFFFYWLRTFMLSSLVWTRGLWVFSLVACSCPVLHMAGDFISLAMCLCFCFVWTHGFCLRILCAMCSHVNCLDPTYLVTWLLVHLPHLCLSRYPPHLLSL